MAEKKNNTFEADMSRLEEIVSQLERGDVPLEQAIALFEEGTKLAAQCSKRLDEAEQMVTRLSRSADGSYREDPVEQVEA